MSRHEHIKQFEIESDAVKALRLARQLIEQGWCQRIASVVKNDRHERCASQAILDAVFRTEKPRGRCASLIDEANRLFIVAIGCLNNNIPDWNDDRRRTKEEVLTAFDRAIKIGLGRG